LLYILEKADEIIVPTIVFGELYHGFWKSGKITEKEEKLNQFLKIKKIKTWTLTKETVSLFGEISWRLRKELVKGLSQNDIWIGAIVKENNAWCVTRDEKFKLMGIKVKTY
jgi:predicted nucleic acid-binding protein